jgi:16S rRNA (cytidine1402-2'-O)-methyltransferase
LRAKAASINPPEGLPGDSTRTFTVAGHVLSAPKAAPGLHLVATPIVSATSPLRALKTLAGVDIMAGEDIRGSRTPREAARDLLNQHQ